MIIAYNNLLPWVAWRHWFAVANIPFTLSGDRIQWIIHIWLSLYLTLEFEGYPWSMIEICILRGFPQAGCPRWVSHCRPPISSGAPHLPGREAPLAHGGRLLQGRVQHIQHAQPLRRIPRSPPPPTVAPTPPAGPQGTPYTLCYIPYNL